MTTPTAEELLNTVAEDGNPVLGCYELSSEAAYNAGRILVENWAQALYDGTTLDECLADVDIVIGLLAEWKSAVRENWSTL